MSNPWIGRRLAGRYEIDSLLGQGGMSAVYQATDLNLRRVVAVKMIHPHLSNTPEFIQRFESEAAMVAQLRHQNIVQVFDFAHAEDVYYMVLEFIAGETLQERLRRLAGQDRALSVEELVGYGTDLTGALEYAHKRGLIHRDIKPANVLLDVHGKAILTDFGVARMVGETHITATGDVLGTAHYMSPEQISGERVDHRTDLYSMGVMLYEMVSGRLPYDADSALTVMRMHLQDPLPDLSEIRPGTPARLIAVIEKALQKVPADRFSSAADLGQALQEVLAPAPGTQPGRADRTVLEEPGAGADPSGPDQTEMVEEETRPRPEVPEGTVIEDTWRRPEATEGTVIEDTGQRPEASGATVLEDPVSPPVTGEAAPARPRPPVSLPQIPPDLQDLLNRVPAWGWGLGAVLVLAVFALVARPWDWFSGDPTEAPATQPAPTIAAVVTEALAPTATPPPPTEAPTPVPTPTPVPLTAVTRGNAGRLAQSMILGQGAFISAAQSPDGGAVAIGGSLGVWVYDLADPTAPRHLDGHTDRVGDVAWSPDGARLASASDDTTVRLWDPMSGAELRTLAGHTRRVRTVAWSPDGRYLISGGSDGDLRIWDPESGAELELLSGNVLHVWSVAWSPAADEFAWGGNDGLVRVQSWDGSSPGPLRALRGHSGNVWEVHWSQDGAQVASVGEDGTVRVWEAATGAQLDTADAGGNWVAELGWEGVEPILTAGFMDGLITVSARPDQTPLLTAGGFVDWITHLAWAPSGAWLAGASLDATVRVWDALTGQELAVLGNPAGPVTGLALRAGDGALALGSEDGSWAIWEGELAWEQTFQGPPLVAGVTDMAWSPDGRTLAMAGADGAVALWDTETESGQTLAGHQAGVNGLAWSPDGGRLASASSDNSARIWDVTAGETILTLTGHSDVVTALAWSPDGGQLATVTADGLIRVWDPVDGRAIRVLEESLELLAVAWSPDGELLVSGSTDGNDGFVTVWGPGDEAPLAQLLGHRSAVTGLGWGPEGARLASSSREGAIRVWSVPGE